MAQPIVFNYVPQNLRLPGEFAEVSNARANTNQTVQRALVIGQMSAGGTATPNVPVRVPSKASAQAMFGIGSMLALMVVRYLAIDPTREVWALPLSDAPGAAATAWTATFTGPATASGTIFLHVGGQLVQTAVAAGQNATTIAQNVVSACAQVPTLPMTAAANAGVVTFTSVNAGTDAGDTNLVLNLKGVAGGQVLPAGVGCVVSQSITGATNPSLTAGLANALPMSFDFIVNPLTDAASVAALTAFMTDAPGGRWNPLKQLYGGVFGATRGPYGTLGGFCAGLQLNDQHQSFIGVVPGAPEPSWIWAASFAAAAAASLANNPAQPLQDLAVPGLIPPTGVNLFTPDERNALLWDGISTFYVASGVVYIENLITTYTTSPLGAPDNSYLEVEKLFTIAAVLRARQSLRQSLGRCVLVSDATPIPPNPTVPMVSPSTVKALIIAQQNQLQANGWVQNAAAFAQAVVVQQNQQDPDRLDVLDPTAISDQLRRMAFSFQFTQN